MESRYLVGMTTSGTKTNRPRALPNCVMSKDIMALYNLIDTDSGRILDPDATLTMVFPASGGTGGYILCMSRNVAVVVGNQHFKMSLYLWLDCRMGNNILCYRRDELTLTHLCSKSARVVTRRTDPANVASSLGSSSNQFLLVCACHASM